MRIKIDGNKAIVNTAVHISLSDGQQTCLRLEINKAITGHERISYIDDKGQIVLCGDISREQEIKLQQIHGNIARNRFVELQVTYDLNTGDILDTKVL